MQSAEAESEEAAHISAERFIYNKLRTEFYIITVDLTQSNRVERQIFPICVCTVIFFDF